MIIRRAFRFAPALLAAAAGVLLLGACKGRHCGWHGSAEEKADRLADRLARKLDLDDRQKAALDALKADLLARKADFRAVHDGFHAEALGALRSGTVDTAALNRGLEAREEKMRELRALLVEKFAAFHAVLEPAQREKLAARLESHWDRCK
jgi:Spy/CpxP family protein refolding chaperone